MRRSQDDQRRKWLWMGVRHAYGAPGPRSSVVQHLLPTGAVQRRPAVQNHLNAEMIRERMAARDLRASQGTVVSSDDPILHRGIGARVIACERCEERRGEVVGLRAGLCLPIPPWCFTRMLHGFTTFRGRPG